MAATPSTDPGFRLFHALNGLSMVFGSSQGYIDFAERREHSQDLAMRGRHHRIALEEAERKRQIAAGLPVLSAEEWFRYTHAIITAPFRPTGRPEYVDLLRERVEAARRAIGDARQALLDGAADMMDRAINPGGMRWSVELDTTLDEADLVLASLWVGLKEPTIAMGDAASRMPDLGRTFRTRTNEVISVRRRLPPRASAAGPGATPDVGVAGTSDRPTIGGTGTDWREVQARLLGKREREEPYTSNRQLAAEMDCSTSTIRKAIKNSVNLKGWRGRSNKARPKATSLSDVLTDSIPQNRELAPEESLSEEQVDAVMARLIDEARPTDRAKLHSLDGPGRRAMVETVQAQAHDYEPSAAAPDARGRKPFEVRQHKRL